MPKERVAILGSGNWGSAIAKIIGENASAKSHMFEREVRVWVFEEEVDGRKLTEIVNSDHENPKYLPGVRLPDNVVAYPSAVSAMKDATLLVFVLPHQFIPRLCKTLQGHIHPRARAISLVKGLSLDKNGPVLISSLISGELNGMDCSVLMGANVANEVAREKFCESTVGACNTANGEVFRELFDRPYFLIRVVNNVSGVEMCGALKNVVAIGAGLCDGLGLGTNTKSAIMRIGLGEMMNFIRLFYTDVPDTIFFESCGIADLITTCFGGRNRKCAEVFARTGKSWEEIEVEVLKGQKLQGTLTAKEVHEVLENLGKVDDFPLFKRIYDIAYEGVPASHITHLSYAPMKSKL